MTNQQDGRSPADAGSGSQASPAAPSGSAPSVSIPNADEIAQAAAASLSPTLFEPHIKRAVDEIYESLLFSVQDYLIENAHWNIRGKIDAANERAANLYSALLAIRDFRPDPADCDPRIPDAPYIVIARECKGIARAAVGGYWRPASGIEAATADETRSGSAVGESPAAESRDAQGQSV